jgi:hypothetical protein
MQIVVICLSNVHPVFAAIAPTLSSKQSTAASTISSSTIKLPKWYRMLRKIVFGVTADGKRGGNLGKIGDTRFDNARLIRFVTTGCVMILGIFFTNFWIQREEQLMLARMRKEAQREVQYREVRIIIIQ